MVTDATPRGDGTTSTVPKCIGCGKYVWSHEEVRNAKHPLCKPCRNVIDALFGAATQDRIEEFSNADPERRKVIFSEVLKECEDSMGSTGPVAVLMMFFRDIQFGTKK